jgi:hypothetical protein
MCKETPQLSRISHTGTSPPDVPMRKGVVRVHSSDIKIRQHEGSLSLPAMLSNKSGGKRVRFAEGAALCFDGVKNQIKGNALYNRRLFRNEVEAIEFDRKRVGKLLDVQFFAVRTKLSSFQLIRTSVKELESLQGQVLTDLDNLRQVDPATGETCETWEYSQLENKLQALLEAWEYFTQKAYLEDLIAQKAADVSFEDKEGERVEDRNPHNVQKYTCFSFILKKSSRSTG